MSKFVPITVAAKALGVSASTWRRWEGVGKLVPARKLIDGVKAAVRDAQ